MDLLPKSNLGKLGDAWGLLSLLRFLSRVSKCSQYAYVEVEELQHTNAILPLVVVLDVEDGAVLVVHDKVIAAQPHITHSCTISVPPLANGISLFHQKTRRLRLLQTCIG